MTVPEIDAALTALSELALDLRIATDSDTLTEHGRDWTRFHSPAPSAVLFPGDIAAVQAIVGWARPRGIALVPSGGRTGLSGGAVAAAGEVVVSFDRMNTIGAYDPVDSTVTVGPGVITERLQQFAREQGRCYPVDFASRGSSQIGGNIATNAGGIKVLRYGLTRDWITGLKVVTGSGELLDLNRGLTKNATGYDLRHLMIGSEGTLGLIVEATVRLAPAPRELSVMVLGIDALDGVMAVFEALRERLALTAFEFFTDKAMAHVTAKGVARPFESDTPYYVLAEFEHIRDDALDQALAAFETCVDNGWVSDGVISQSEGQAQALWRLREDITESIAPFTPYKNDIATRVSRVPAFLTAMDTLFATEYPQFEVIWFGHIGDGNLHISVLKPQDWSMDDFKRECERVSDHLFRTLAEHEGSISAEHGVGLIKKPYLHYSRSPAERAYLKAIKQVFDPDGILNPGKLLD